jgi:DNA topoisomerase-1
LPKDVQGIELENERVGLITYMRTDSTRLASEFITSAKDFITHEFGSHYYRGYQEQGKPEKNVQDAHEAIRPSKLSYTQVRLKPIYPAKNIRFML